jgi:hypothetical protein
MIMKALLKAVLFVSGALIALPAGAVPCNSWSAESHLSVLPFTPFKEVSGIAASQQFPGRMYLVNDSGDGGRFYSYDTSTGNFESVAIEGFKSFDIEAVSVGPCGDDSCIYIGDIGNNNGTHREIVRIVAIKEKATFGNRVTPLIHKKLNYPGEPQDAEALVVTSLGAVYIFSKDFDERVDWDGVGPSHIFRTTYDDLKTDGIGDLEDVGRLNVNHFGLPTNVFTVTDAALSSDESSIMFMTYFQGVEMSWPELESQMGDANSMIWMNYKGFPINVGLQSEAVTYSYPEDDIIWTYESPRADSPLILRSCNY